MTEIFRYQKIGQTDIIATVHTNFESDDGKSAPCQTLFFDIRGPYDATPLNPSTKDEHGWMQEQLTTAEEYDAYIAEKAKLIKHIYSDVYEALKSKNYQGVEITADPLEGAKRDLQAPIYCRFQAYGSNNPDDQALFQDFQEAFSASVAKHVDLIATLSKIASAGQAGFANPGPRR